MWANENSAFRKLSFINYSIKIPTGRAVNLSFFVWHPQGETASFHYAGLCPSSKQIKGVRTRVDFQPRV